MLLKNKTSLKLIFSILVFSGILDIHAQELKNSDFFKNESYFSLTILSA